ncbi:MAG: amidophosphoribosyltransferase, partial [Methanosarcinaceae archaeon]|nr:amidophosphoribosyltransferase [Methanosarcinaceae archaeon]
IYYSLYALQHRGQESTGIAIHDGTKMHTIKGMGLVPDVYDRELISKIYGNVGIGHVRYSTKGTSTIENCQPFVVKFKDGDIGIAHNGTLVNGDEIRSELKAEGHVTLTDSDTEVIAHLLVKELLKREPVDALHAVMHRLVGSYSIVVLINDILFAARDPLGIKPLCIGTIEGGHIIASESVAIDTINGVLERDVKPGEIIFFKDGKIQSHQAFHEKHSAHCVFEYIYFARPDSIIDGKLVYNVRKRIGMKLAQESPSDANAIMPVPDSGITSAIGYSKESNIEYCEGLMKNRYIGRTFIIPEQKMRETAVRLKMNTIPENIKGKRVVLVDDSMVRGTTSRRI